MKEQRVSRTAGSAALRPAARQSRLQPNAMLELQRLVGNAAVVQLIGSPVVPRAARVAPNQTSGGLADFLPGLARQAINMPDAVSANSKQPAFSSEEETSEEDKEMSLQAKFEERRNGPVQRQPDPKAEFMPRLVPSPQKGAALLGEVYTQTVNIENAAEAPKGTTYQWRYRMGPGSVTPTGKADLEGPSSSYSMILRSVGDNFLVPAVYTTSPGRQKEVDTTAVTIVVPQPQLVRSKLETEAGGKRRPMFESMIVGEDLIVTIELGQIDKKTVDSAPGSFIQVPGLTHVRTVAVAPGVYEIVLHASHVLGALGAVAALPFDTRLGQVPAVGIRVDIEPKDSTDTPDTRPVNVAGAKSWLHSDYTNLFQQLRLGNDALVRQSKVNDPPPKSPLWLDILLGAVTAALGGVTAAIGITIADRLVGKDSERLHEAIKVFFESTLATSATAALTNLGADPKEMSGDRAPHLRFFTAHQTALNTAERKMKQEELTNRVEPRIDLLEMKEPGKGFRAAVELDRGLKAAIADAEKIEFDKSFVAWVNFVTRGQLGSVNKNDPDAATDMSKQLSPRAEGFPTRGAQSAPGVVAIEVEGNILGKPEVPVKISKSYMHGMDETLRKKISTYAVKDLPFALIVRGGAPGRFDGPWAFSRNENGGMWLSDETHEYLERKGHGTARDGANKILFQEIGDERLKPEA